jgi:hypothetical protein
MRIHTDINEDAHSRASKHAHTQTHTYTHIDTLTHMHARTHTHMHACTHTHNAGHNIRYTYAWLVHFCERRLVQHSPLHNDWVMGLVWGQPIARTQCLHCPNTHILCILAHIWEVWAYACGHTGDGAREGAAVGTHTAPALSKHTHTLHISTHLGSVGICVWAYG